MADDLETMPKQADRSLGELFGQLTSDTGELIRKEVQLARVELKEEAQRAGKAGGMLAGAGVVALLAAIALTFALAWLLDEWMPRALAFLIVGVLWLIVAAALYGRGRAEMKNVKPVPEQTVTTLKEDVQWARAQKN